MHNNLEQTEHSVLRFFDDANIDTIQISKDDYGRSFSEEEVLNILSQQVDYLLQHHRSWMLGKLYRLDVREKDLNRVLSEDVKDPAPVALAKLIIERQKERNNTKEKYQSKPLEPTDEHYDLRW